MVQTKDHKIRPSYNHTEIVKKFKELQANDPYENPRILLKTVFSSITEDFVEDAEMPRSQILEGTELQKKFKQLAKYIRAKSEAKKRGVETKVGPLEAIDVPFSIINTETGAIVKGFVNENLQNNVKELTPVSSSNVKGVGQFKNELLVQFIPSGLTPQRTYRYEFGDIRAAEEAYRSLTTTGSPGRWVWQNIRGHTAGEKVTQSKLAPSIVPPGKGLPTIGGTSASLVKYEVSNRVPVSRVQGFEGMVKKLERITPNPVSNPMTGSGVEQLLGTRRALREIGVSRTGKYSQLPKLDFTVEYIGNIKDFDDRKGRWITVRGRHIFIKPGQKLQFDEDGHYIRTPISKKQYEKEKEERTQKYIEQTGHTREKAEEYIKQKRKEAKKESRGSREIN
jgi:hypothetical protein